MANVYIRARSALLQALTGAPYTFTYSADGFAVRKKYVPFRHNSDFDAAWSHVSKVNAPYFKGGLPDVRWRAHTCVWAAYNCLQLEGSFAEFGVNTGILSGMICRTLGPKLDSKKFYLFDTFTGVPIETVSAYEAKNVKKLNDNLYTSDVFDFTQSEFKKFKNVELVRGVLPETLSAIDSVPLSYLSIDLNSASTEMAVISRIWDQIVPGGHVVLDDYGFGQHEEQNFAWNEFAASVGKIILAMPTGQGILIK